jgi:hypothetical protein
LEYQLKDADLDRCINFAINFYLGSGKNTTNRTTGQYRGLGGILDSFIIGKLIEIGVAKIIQKNSNKKCILDFDIHGINKDNVNDPDIIKINEDGEEREPELFIEIKNISPNDRWVGLTTEQFSTILSNKIVNEDKNKAFVIYASLISNDDKLDFDPLGVYLKSKTDINLFDGFASINDLKIKIQYILSAKELDEQGVRFNEGSYLYETDIFTEASSRTSNNITNRIDDEVYVPVQPDNNKIPIIMCRWGKNLPDSNDYSFQFGDFIYDGKIEIFRKKNPKSNKIYIKCNSDVVIKNHILGEFNLENNKIYDCCFDTVGWNPTLKRNNIWIAQRNLENLVEQTVEERINQIKNNI